MMDPQQLINPHTRRPKILVIYQGTEATQFREHVVQKINEYGAVPVLLSSDQMHVPDDVPISVRYLDKINDCDGALAIVTNDSRPASSVGNLWLEIGLWWGMKSRSTIRIMLQSQPESNSSLPGSTPLVALPTDMDGGFYPRFVGPKDMDAPILAFIQQTSQRLAGAQGIDRATAQGYSKERRIRDTVLRGRSDCPVGPLKHCHLHPTAPEPVMSEPCSYRESSLNLISELLRMARSHREHAVFETCLYRISQLSFDFVELTEHITARRKSSEARLRNERWAKYNALRDVVTLLRDTATLLLERRDSYENYLSSWERVVNYLAYRELVHDCRGSSSPDDTSIEELAVERKADAHKFCKWAEAFIDRPTSRRLFAVADRPTQSSDHDDPLANPNIMTYGYEYTLKLATILTPMGTDYFRDCRAAINGPLARIADAHSLSIAFASICESLPHNHQNKLHAHIWPRPDQSTLGGKNVSER